jgi:hypothetical protein
MIEKRDDLRKSLVSNVFKGNEEQKLDCHPERMSVEELRSAIPKAVTTSTGRDRPLWGQEGKSPEWWPSDISFLNPKQDFRDTSKRISPWIDTLRQRLAAYLWKHPIGENMKCLFNSTNDKFFVEGNSNDTQVIFVPTTKIAVCHFAEINL